jgi:hypothetical protein
LRSNFVQIFALEFRTNICARISYKYLRSNFGQIFALEFRTNFRPKTGDKFASDNFGLNSWGFFRRQKATKANICKLTHIWLFKIFTR